MSKDKTSFDIVAKNGNGVERMVSLVAFNDGASRLLLVWTGLDSDNEYDVFPIFHEGREFSDAQYTSPAGSAECVEL